MEKEKGLYDLAINKEGVEGAFRMCQFTLNPTKWKNNDELLDKFTHIKMFDYLNDDYTGFSDKVMNLDPSVKGVYLFYVVPQTDCNSGSYLMYVGESTRSLQARIKQYFYEFKRLDKLVRSNKLDTIKASDFRPYVDVMFALWEKHIKIELYIYKEENDENCQNDIADLEAHIYQKFSPPICRRIEGVLSEKDKIINNLFN